MISNENTLMVVFLKKFFKRILDDEQTILWLQAFPVRLRHSFFSITVRTLSIALPRYWTVEVCIINMVSKAPYKVTYI